MSISAKQVKELRERTGAGMMECKTALTEAEGDIDKAIEVLRKKGLAKAAKKAGRVAAEGIIASAMSEDGKSAVLVEVNSETDFVAKNEDFIAFAQAAADLALREKVNDVQALLDASEGGMTMEERRQQIVTKLGENISLRRLKTVVREEAGVSATYVHGSRIGVLVEVSGSDADSAMAKDVAMHVAATKPEYLSPDDVDAERVSKEKEILKAQAADSGKPDEIIEKMIGGRLNKWLAEISLLTQPFVKNPEQKVKDLQKGDAKILNFTRFEVGEGIEKETTDFAAEVMAQVKG